VSRAYRIQVEQNLRKHVQVEDGVQSALELLPILEADRMRELLAAELTKRGFQREGDAAKRAQDGGIVVRVDLDSGEVTVTAEAEVHLDLEDTRTAWVEPARAEEGEQKLAAESRARLEARADAETEVARRELTARLEAALDGLKDELDQATNRVTAEALKQRAAELGTVEEVHEEENGNLTIKVRV